MANPITGDNAFEESLSGASDSEHLLHYGLEFQEARTEKFTSWKRSLQSNILGRRRSNYTPRSDEDSCTQCGKSRFARKTPLRKCTVVGLWIFASL